MLCEAAHASTASGVASDAGQGVSGFRFDGFGPTTATDTTAPSGGGEADPI